MFSSPESFTTPGLSCSTPQTSGTFTAARTKSRHESDQNKNKENEIKPKLNYSAAVMTGRKPSFSAGSLAEAAVDHQVKSLGGGGDHKVAATTFYGSSQASHSEWNSQITIKPRKKKGNQAKAAEKELEAKINLRSKMNPLERGDWDENLLWHTGLTPPRSRPISTDLNQDLNLTNHDDSLKPTEEKETIDLSSPSPISPIKPSLLPQQVLPPYLIGFKNYGNTCYLNACLQSLLGLQMFITDMMNFTSEELAIDESGQHGLVQSFRKLCVAYSKGDGVIANEEMKMVKKVMEVLDKQFIGNSMQDASEFLSRFIDELNEDAQRLSRSLDMEKKGYEIEKGVDIVFEGSNQVIKNFQHEKEEVLVCHGCRAETKCRIRDMSMWCDTTCSSNMNRTRSMSLQQLLEQSLAKETRERRCEVCGCEEATTISQLVKLPKVLIIILKRYRFNNQDLSSSGKVSRQVSIPETVSLSSLVSDNVTLPDTSLPVLLPHHQTQVSVAVPLPISPVINPVIPSPSPPATPTKFKGLTEEQVAALNEQDQFEYMLYISQKEAHASEKAGEDIDEDLKAALEASMRDDTFNQIMTLAGETDQWVDAGQENCRTPSRKRNYRQFNSDGGQGDEDGVYYSSGIRGEKTTYSKVVEGKASSSSSLPRPTTKEQEEEDLRRALELSTQESGFVDNAVDQMEVDDNENNNNMMVEQDMPTPTPGLPEHTYQLQSVVSHHGNSASFGHYVADVFRFDGGGWHRYDDTRVIRTDARTVMTGPNSSNGYILTYLYQPLWEGCKAEQ